MNFLFNFWEYLGVFPGTQGPFLINFKWDLPQGIPFPTKKNRNNILSRLTNAVNITYQT